MTDPSLLELIRSSLWYDRESGEIRWARTLSNRARGGALAGTRTKSGYITIRIGRKDLRAHRVAWLLAYGAWVLCDIDHKDGNRSNNAIDNLRLATRSQNNANSKRSKRNKSGIKCVHFDKRAGRWMASIARGGKGKFLGYFDKKEDAAIAYRSAAVFIYGEFARVSE